MYDLLTAACLCHPGLRSFSILRSHVPSEARRNGDNLLKDMVMKFERQKEAINEHEDAVIPVEKPSPLP